MSTRPWDKWTAEQRECMAGEYKAGATIRHVATRYHHDRRHVSLWLDFAGLRREKKWPKPAEPKPARHSTPQMRDFCRALLSANGLGLNMANLMNALHERRAQG